MRARCASLATALLIALALALAACSGDAATPDAASSPEQACAYGVTTSWRGG